MPKQDKVRFVVTLNSEDKKKLETIAENDCRSLNSLFNKIIRDYLKSAEEEKK